jgi:hypothetical protein
LIQKLSALQACLRTRPALAAMLIGLAALCVYLRTLAPGIVFGDSPELTTAAYHLGVAHPTGYPLYMLLGYGFTHFLPLGSAAYRMNLLSALAAAAAVALLYLLALRVTRSRLASAATALLMAFSVTFWSRAVIAEAYALHLAFVVAVLLCVVVWDARGDRRWLLAAALLWGLSFTHHMQTALLAPALLYFVLTSRRRGQFLRELRWTIPLFLAPLLLYLYLPLSALRNPPWTFAYTGSWDGFRDHVTARMYRDMMGVPSWGVFRQHLVDYGGWPSHDDTGGHHDSPAYLLSQFSVSLLWLAPWGLWDLFRRRRRLFGLTLLVYLAVVGWALNYNIPNIEVYYLPSHMIVALWIGCGLRQLVFLPARLWRRLRLPRPSRRRLGAGFGAAMLALPLLLLAANREADDMSRDRSAEWLGRALLDALKPNALLLDQGDNWLFPALYPHYVENRRPDVTIVPAYLFVEGTNIQLITRLASRGLVVRVPAAYPPHPVPALRRRFLAQFIADNRRSRPVYIAGPKAELIASLPEMREAVPALRRLGGKEPVFEVMDRDAPGAAPVGGAVSGRMLPDRFRY